MSGNCIWEYSSTFPPLTTCTCGATTARCVTSRFRGRDINSCRGREKLNSDEKTTRREKLYYRSLPSQTAKKTAAAAVRESSHPSLSIDSAAGTLTLMPTAAVECIHYICVQYLPHDKQTSGCSALADKLRVTSVFLHSETSQVRVSIFLDL